VGHRFGVPLARALSKLRLLSRTEAVAAIRAGRVSVDGRITHDPACPIVPERARIAIDAQPRRRPPWRTVVFHKPRGVVTTRRDPEGRTTVFDVLGPVGDGLVAVGRLDRATTGLLLLTSDTQLANWIADPRHAVRRLYVATVRGRVDRSTLDRLTGGTATEAGEMKARTATLRKASSRESQVVIELVEGRNREVRRLFEAAGHEVTKLKRVELGGLALGSLEPGAWRALTRAEIRSAFPGVGRALRL
jgi:23S rRNA pseudouridine2605 synthase